ncbi:AAA family ATPase [Mycolicibacterium hodleri]|uniref:AAA family ATPase n=1 Tax=Mycolicibacterium hodleri TaxID=49897 RepID=UPI001F263003|nr:AAA family ATPase [Mycolicibacterium hodleri]
MKRVLVTGMSGTGKSTLLTALAARGYWTVDTDYGDYFETIDGESTWIEARIDELLSIDDPRGVLFVQGTTGNQVVFYPRFDHIVLLSAPAELIVERLRTRTTNSYGRRPADVAAILENLADVEPLLRASATLEVVTTVPVEMVVDAVLNHVS